MKSKYSKKTKVKPEQLKKLLETHDLQVYDICKICGVTAVTAERWMKDGIPEPEFRLMRLSLGGL